jgi:predicted phosphodiesterase
MQREPGCLTHSVIERLIASRQRLQAEHLAAPLVVLHCGDVVAPSTLSIITPLGLPVHVIHGNNAGDLFAMARFANRPGHQVSFYGQDAGLELAGRRIFLVPTIAQGST